MASIRREIRLTAHPDNVWDVVRDVGAVGVGEMMDQGMVAAHAALDAVSPAVSPVD